MNASVGGDTSLEINNLSPLSLDVWLCYAFIRILAQVSKYRQRSPVIRFRVWPLIISSAYPQIIFSSEISPELYSCSHISPRALSPVSPESATSHLNHSEPEPETFKMGELGAELQGKS